jgi:hypothetical protein
VTIVDRTCPRHRSARERRVLKARTHVVAFAANWVLRARALGSRDPQRRVADGHSVGGYRRCRRLSRRDLHEVWQRRRTASARTVFMRADRAITVVKCRKHGACTALLEQRRPPPFESRRLLRSACDQVGEEAAHAHTISM